MPRLLAKIERRLGVQFPDSYVYAIRHMNALTRFRGDELYSPDQCSWLEDSQVASEHRSATLLEIGMYHRGDARPLVMRRTDPTAPMLEDTIFRYSGDVEPVAESLIALLTPPPRPPTLEEQATELLQAARRRR